MDVRNRRRLQAGLIVAIFAVPVIVMLVLTLTGWVPQGRSYGEPVRPQRDLAAMATTTPDGKPLSFTGQVAEWTLVALPGPGCAQRCLRQLDLVHRAKITLGQHADRLRLVYLGAPPAGPAAKGFEQVWTLASTQSRLLADLRATAPDSVSLVLVNPHGDVLTRYAAGFNPEGVRTDLKKVVR